MERFMLKNISETEEKYVKIPVFVTGMGDLVTPADDKPYFDVHVTDGEESAVFPLRDKRVDAAKQRFLKQAVYITLSISEKPYIARIEACTDVPASEFGDVANVEPEVKKPERVMLRDISKFMNKSCRLPVLVTGMGPLKKSANGKPYYPVTITDGEETATYNMWDDQFETNKDHFLNKPVYMTLNVEEYTKVTRLEECSDIPVKEFVRKAPVESEAMYNEILTVLGGMKSTMAPVAIKMYEENKEELLRWAGALKMHHSVYGGLLYHKYRMMKSAMSICEIYPSLNRELLIIGTLLHDIGKLRELNTNELGVSEFTVFGNLSGHVLIGVELLTAAVYGMEDKPDAEEFRLVKHMIASHHGALEYGAIVVPATPEAMVLNYLDLIDSRMYMFEETLSGMEKGAVSDRVYALGNAHIYKANYKEKDGDADAEAEVSAE